MDEKKRCSNCAKKKPVSDFYAHPTTKDRLQSWCRDCMSRAANARNKRIRKEKKVQA